jgi:hypothetical protein
MSFPVPQCVQDHPAFQPNISRDEAEFILSSKFVLRVNSDGQTLIVTYTQPNGTIAHSAIDIDSTGQVRTGFHVFPTIDAFVVWLRTPRDNSVWPSPPVSELQRIPQLANFVFDARMSKDEMRQRLVNLPFLMWPSSKRRAWVVTRLHPGTAQLVHLFVRPAPSGQGFVIESKSDVVFGSLVELLQSVDLVPRVAPSPRPIYGSFSDVPQPQPQIPSNAPPAPPRKNSLAASAPQYASFAAANYQNAFPPIQEVNYDDPSVLYPDDSP